MIEARGDNSPRLIAIVVGTLTQPQVMTCNHGEGDKNTDSCLTALKCGIVLGKVL